MQFYQPPEPNLWHGRTDSDRKERIHQITHCVDITDSVPMHTRLAVIGFASDAGVVRNQGRPGAKMGPNAIRQTLATMAIPPTLKQQKLIDVGNIICPGDELEAAQQALATCIDRLRAENILPLVLGGGHETAWGHYLGFKNHIDKNLSIINFDAHYDLRPLLDADKGSSGTPFLQIAKHCQSDQKPFQYTCLGIQQAANTQSLFETAEALHVQSFYADEIEFTTTRDALNRTIYEADQIYLSICMDVFAMSVVPGVSAPQPLGILPHQMLPLYRSILDSGKVTALDIVELAPCFDQDHRSTKLAAALLWHALCL